MTPAALMATSLGLSTDAFAAALARGGAAPASNLRSAVKVGAVFGLSEGTMCLLGWALASQFSALVTLLDHWIALFILGAIGARMVYAGMTVRAGEEDRAPRGRSGFLGTVFTALGTSVDAAAVGVAFAFIAVEVWAAVTAIALTSFTMSTIGYLIGPRVGARLGGRAEIAGGLMLMGIGVFIFISHMTAGG